MDRSQALQYNLYLHIAGCTILLPLTSQNHTSKYLCHQLIILQAWLYLYQMLLSLEVSNELLVLQSWSSWIYSIATEQLILPYVISHKVIIRLQFLVSNSSGWISRMGRFYKRRLRLQGRWIFRLCQFVLGQKYRCIVKDVRWICPLIRIFCLQILFTKFLISQIKITLKSLDLNLHSINEQISFLMSFSKTFMEILSTPYSPLQTNPNSTPTSLSKTAQASLKPSPAFKPSPQEKCTSTSPNPTTFSSEHPTSATPFTPSPSTTPVAVPQPQKHFQ